MSKLLQLNDLKMYFPVPEKSLFRRDPRWLRAVDGVSLEIHAGEVLGVVGESGCGKSTLARAVLGLEKITAGTITLDGVILNKLNRRQWKSVRASMQIVFQDPLASLDPRMTVGEIIAEPLNALVKPKSRPQRRLSVEQVMHRVGLSPDLINRYPHEFSGGQCQRIGIARALVTTPRLLICDEPVSALDVSVQAQVINLLTELQREFGLSMMFISHDLAVVKHISQRILVMYLGRVVEIATRGQLFQHPRHPYTRTLIDAIPIPDPAIERAKQRNRLLGELPSPLSPPSGCEYRNRCPRADSRCAAETPVLRKQAPGHQVACHFPE